MEHDHKCQIKLVILEEKLVDHGYTNAEITEKLEEARNKLEAAAADSEDSDGVANATAVTKKKKK